MKNYINFTNKTPNAYKIILFIPKILHCSFHIEKVTLLQTDVAVKRNF